MQGRPTRCTLCKYRAFGDIWTSVPWSAIFTSQPSDTNNLTHSSRSMSRSDSDPKPSIAMLISPRPSSSCFDRSTNCCAWGSATRKDNRDMSAKMQARTRQCMTSSVFCGGARPTLGDNRSEICAAVGYSGCRSGSTAKSAGPSEEESIPKGLCSCWSSRALSGRCGGRAANRSGCEGRSVISLRRRSEAR